MGVHPFCIFSARSGAENLRKGGKAMEKDPIASARVAIKLATEELHEIMLYAHNAHCGIFMQTRDVISDLRRAMDELEKIGQNQQPS